ncbi:hypothetical protein DUNSADRAFT_9080 [Dunaliella salina]|uniref:Uncharacterized protein n=1 Tax=Dunaliella salina TaxID=3046 RepID=A0ABQ7H5L0_DUNSA|nr:hypothetical protein DUNSADRAFT_9080 [Dunaliella salina]|eukprot:KAF5842121.1 hypothetical protein DUNSADRAFT_9080 [Dunaliella salina]
MKAIVLCSQTELKMTYYSRKYAWVDGHETHCAALVRGGGGGQVWAPAAVAAAGPTSAVDDGLLAHTDGRNAALAAAAAAAAMISTQTVFDMGPSNVQPVVNDLLRYSQHLSRTCDCRYVSRSIEEDGHPRVSVSQREERHAQEAQPGDVLLLKGHAWPGNMVCGVVHKSPILDNCGCGAEHEVQEVTRLVLSIDTATDW